VCTVRTCTRKWFEEETYIDVCHPIWQCINQTPGLSVWKARTM
jgi:hypothetical protein